MTDAARQPTHWTWKWRCGVFILASTSLGCLLADFYGLCSMRVFSLVVFAPAMLLLGVAAGWDAAKGKGQLARAVLIGAGAGLAAALAYDVFRLPFVFARQWGIESLVPSLSLFKVFPEFGAMLL